MRPKDAQWFLENLGRRADEARPERTDSTEWEGDRPRCTMGTLMAVTVLAFLSIGSIAIGKVMLEHAVSKRLLAVDPGQRGVMLVTANMTSPLFVVNVSALNYSDFAIVGVF
ncbi:hypothetical protein HPB51_006895 [Rhipicephalus microplus]|uniref:Uncharacterized protein n=1 Tax=Rhipicephalus microplus TaxID=6941 RepID=A0A9J6E7X2_RHIMP|nr:hypothetical protein HPB51_006895 [Rhipicephalus microplus]